MPATPGHCAACGHTETTEDPLVTPTRSTFMGVPLKNPIHRSHFKNPASGFYGEPYKEQAGDPK